MRILLIDDEPIILACWSRLLARAGHTVITSGNGKQGLAEFHRGNFDLIIVDQLLPDGPEGGEVISNVRESNNVPIIWITGHFDEWGKMEQQVTSLTNVWLLLKPFMFADLLQVLAIIEAQTACS